MIPGHGQMRNVLLPLTEEGSPGGTFRTFLGCPSRAEKRGSEFSRGFRGRGNELQQKFPGLETAGTGRAEIPWPREHQ